MLQLEPLFRPDPRIRVSEQGNCSISSLNSNLRILFSLARARLPLSSSQTALSLHGSHPIHTWSVAGREIGNLLPNNRRQRRTCYALCHILYPVSAAHTSIFRMDSNSTSYCCGEAPLLSVTLGGVPQEQKMLK